MIRSKPRAAETAAFIRERIAARPEVGLLTGTGLGDSAQILADAVAFDYRLLPHFPVATVPGHAGRLLVGRLAGRTVMALQGRFHLYEGYSPLEVTFPVRVMQELGIGCLVVSNAAGGLNPAFTPGAVMLIRDHLNLTGANPLAGPNADSWGPRSPDMSRAYDAGLAEAARRTSAAGGLGLVEGVYAGLRGPSLETPAEVRYLRTIGADAVGFSTVAEVIAAVHAGMRVLGLSIVTNVHDPDRPQPASVEEILAVAGEAAPRLAAIIEGVVGAL